MYEAAKAVPDRPIVAPVHHGPIPGLDPGAHNCAPAVAGSFPLESVMFTVQ